MIKVKNAKSYNCPNCGGEISHSYNHKCEYCGGMLDFNEPDVIEVKPEDLVDVKLREIYTGPENNSFILVFDGYKCPMPKVYETDGEGTFMSKIENYVNPPKCGFCIEINKAELQDYGISYLNHIILNTGLRYNEIDNVMRQVLNNKEIRFFGGIR